MAGGEYPPEVRWALSFIGDHLNERITLSRVAKHAGVCPDYLNRLFKQYLDCSFHAYVIREKMCHADGFLGSGMRVGQVAGALALSRRTLERWYERLYGITPEERRQGLVGKCRLTSVSDVKVRKLTH